VAFECFYAPKKGDNFEKEEKAKVLTNSDEKTAFKKGSVDFEFLLFEPFWFMLLGQKRWLGGPMRFEFRRHFRRGRGSRGRVALSPSDHCRLEKKERERRQKRRLDPNTV